MPVVTPIVRHSISSQKPPHQSRQRNQTTPYKKMDMVGQQSPSKTWCLGFQKKKSETVKKGVTILIVLEDPLPFDPSDDEMVNSTGTIDPCSPGHKNSLPNLSECVNL